MVELGMNEWINDEWIKCAQSIKYYVLILLHLASWCPTWKMWAAVIITGGRIDWQKGKDNTGKMRNNESTHTRAKTTPKTWKQLSKREHDLRQWKVRKEMKFRRNKARYTATPIECAWAGAVCEIKKAFRQDQWAKIPQKCRKINKKWRTSGPTDGRNRLPATKKWGRKTKMWMYGEKRGKKGKGEK